MPIVDIKNESRFNQTQSKFYHVDIMSQLSTRLGVNTVAPPVAAGELNRPLFSEFERIILNICMRCVSIDEIDSLDHRWN